MKHLALSVAALVVLAALPLATARADTEAGIKTKGALYSEGARDLGAPPPPGVAPQDKRNAAFLELDPYLHTSFTERSGFFTRLQLFGAAGDKVVQNENELPVASQAYAALREFWLEWGGITDFPGDRFRLGLQRVREPAGLWWDRDVESLRWMFDTTLVQADFGVGEQFAVYRTDDVKLSPSQSKRAYAWGDLERQWRPGYFVGARAAYSQDHGSLPESGATVDAQTKTQERQYLWLGLHTHNGYYDPRNTMVMQYGFEAVGLVGSRNTAQTDPNPPADPTLVIGESKTKVGAFAGDAGLRFRIPSTVPVIFGVQATYAQGDPGNDTEHIFQPTGLESNRARFTGTRTLINRFNEALQAKWSNLRDAAGYFSLAFENGDLSAIYHQIKRDNGNADFRADGFDARPVNDSTDIGQGVDLIITKYFSDIGTKASSDDEDQRSNVRLRASQFTPGEAYGPGVDPQYRVTLETTLWF